MYLHPKNRSFSFQKRPKMFPIIFECSQNAAVKICRLEFLFQNLPFSKFAGKKMCHFRVNGRAIRHIFHRFQNVPISCERSLNLWTSLLLKQRSEMILFMQYIDQGMALRLDLFGQLSDISGIDLTRLDDRSQCNLLLYGSSRCSVIENSIILESTISYIKDTGRFD